MTNYTTEQLDQNSMEILKLCKENVDKCITLLEEPKLDFQFYMRHNRHSHYYMSCMAKSWITLIETIKINFK